MINELSEWVDVGHKPLPVPRVSRSLGAAAGSNILVGMCSSCDEFGLFFMCWILNSRSSDQVYEEKERSNLEHSTPRV